VSTLSVAAQVNDEPLLSVSSSTASFRGVVVRRLPPPLEPYPGPPMPLVLFSLAICIGVTLLASMPLSRAIVRPVEALAGSVRRFGAAR
jgi:hypothetical protein